MARQKHIVDAFRQAGATSETAAVAPATIGISEGLALRKLREHAVLRETSAGVFYLDESTWEALRTRRRRIVLGVLLILLVILLAALFSWFATR